MQRTGSERRRVETWSLRGCSWVAAVFGPSLRWLCRSWDQRTDRCTCFQWEEAVILSYILEDRVSVTKVVFHSMHCTKLDVWHEPFQKGPFGRLRSVFQREARMNERKVCVLLFGVRRRMIRSIVGMRALCIRDTLTCNWQVSVKILGLFSLVREWRSYPCLWRPCTSAMSMKSGSQLPHVAKKDCYPWSVVSQSSRLRTL